MPVDPAETDKWGMVEAGFRGSGGFGEGWGCSDGAAALVFLAGAAGAWQVSRPGTTSI